VRYSCPNVITAGYSIVFVPASLPTHKVLALFHTASSVEFSSRAMPNIFLVSAGDFTPLNKRREYERSEEMTKRRSLKMRKQARSAPGETPWIH
jgi:hypothetical protein